MNSITAALWIVIAIAFVSLGLIVYCVVARQPIPEVVLGLLGVVLGFLGNHLASAQGASQALLTPPGTTLTQAPPPQTVMAVPEQIARMFAPPTPTPAPAPATAATADPNEGAAGAPATPQAGQAGEATAI